MCAWRNADVFGSARDGGGGFAHFGGGVTGCVCPPCTRPVRTAACRKTTYNPVRGDCPTCACCPKCAPPPGAPSCPATRPRPLFCEDCALVLGKNLLKAAQAGWTHDVRRLLDSGACVNFTFRSDWTALHRAAATCHADVVALLLKNGADADAQTCCGFTALHMAAWQDFSGRCVALLLNAGAYVDAWNGFRRTPLHYAAESGNEAAVRALVAAGASKITKDEKGMTPFDVARNAHIRRLMRRI